MSGRVRQALGSGIRFLVLGLGLTIAVALGCGAMIDLSATPATLSGTGRLAVFVQSRPGAERVVAQWQPPAAWSPDQAAGPPNTPRYGDFPTAWAPATQNGSSEWLLLTYDHPMRIRAIDVYETLTPGALTKVSLITDRGEERVAWEGVDPTPPAASGGVSHVAIADPSLPACRKVKLYVGVPSITGWNEIDAVGAVDDAGQKHWAILAEASSYYGEPVGGAGTRSPAAKVPSWASGRLPMPEPSDPAAMTGTTAADARGWPILALWTPVNEQTLANSVSTTTSGALPRSAVLPWRPIWWGVIFNTLLFAAVLAVLRLSLTRPARFLLEVRRMRGGRCLRCGYDLNFDFIHGCPECGWRRALPRATAAGKGHADSQTV